MATARARAKLSLKARAVQWLAMREHSRLELRRKLLAQGAKERRLAAAEQRAVGDVSPSESVETVDAEAFAHSVEALLDQLAAQGLLNEQRFVESRLRLRAPKHGNQRIRAELSQHGVQLTSSQRAALTDSEHLRAFQLWSRRFGAVAADDPAERSRQMQFLARRGFSADVVRRVVNGRFEPPIDAEHAGSDLR